MFDTRRAPAELYLLHEEVLRSSPRQGEKFFVTNSLHLTLYRCRNDEHEQSLGRCGVRNHLSGVLPAHGSGGPASAATRFRGGRSLRRCFSPALSQRSGGRSRRPGWRMVVSFRDSRGDRCSACQPAARHRDELEANQLVSSTAAPTVHWPVFCGRNTLQKSECAGEAASSRKRSSCFYDTAV